MYQADFNKKFGILKWGSSKSPDLISKSPKGLWVSAYASIYYHKGEYSVTYNAFMSGVKKS
jgi:hypothetical protein